MSIEISSPAFGNIGNKMLQYMVCWKLHKIIPNSCISDICIEEFNIKSHPSNIKDPNKTIFFDDKNDLDFVSIAKYAEKFSDLKISMQGFFQKISLYPSLEECRNLFFSDIIVEDRFDDDELVINIRCGEIASGQVSWYPILPVAFYEHIISITGLRPVFVGQLDNKIYMEKIINAFPDARYIPSKGALYDFQLVRSAKNIAISVSTFSWLAAWLSNAKNIFYPLAGFLNPALQKAYEQVELFTDFAATEDERFRFFQMPFFHNEEISSLIRHHDSFYGQIYEVLPETVLNLKRSPFVKKKILPAYAVHKGKVDPLWYLKNYPIAAREISEGYYTSVDQHYDEIGWRRNYSPISNKYIPTGSVVVSNGCPANQSSVAVQWSHGNTTETDAAALVNGSVLESNFNHTLQQDNVWWNIDLGRVCKINCISLQNRIENSDVEKRLFPLEIEISEDGSSFTKISYLETYTYPEEKLLICHFSPVRNARFVKIILPGINRMLSIRQVKIYEKK